MEIKWPATVMSTGQKTPIPVHYMGQDVFKIYYPPVYMPLWCQNDHTRDPKWRLSAEIIIHLWVLGRVPVLSDLIHFSSSLGTKVAALTLDNDTRPVSFDHGFILGLHRYTS